MENWDKGQLSTLTKGQTLSCNALTKGQLYGIFLYNSQTNDQDAEVLVIWSTDSPPVAVTVPGTTANSGLATLVLVSGDDTTSVAVSIAQSSANPQIQCWLGSVSMPIDSKGISNQELPITGEPMPFGRLARYYNVPPTAWQMLTIMSPSINQFISAQFQQDFATIYIVNPASDSPNPSVVGVGSVATNPEKFYKITPAEKSSPQSIQEPIMGTGTQWVWMNADSAQDSMAATISLQALSGLLVPDPARKQAEEVQLHDKKRATPEETPRKMSSG